MRFEFGKFNFASGFYHCRFYIRRFSTTIYNVLLVSTVFNLVPGFRYVRQSQFLCLSVIPGDFYQAQRYRKFHSIQSGRLFVPYQRCYRLCDDHRRRVGISPGHAAATGAAPDG